MKNLLTPAAPFLAVILLASTPARAAHVYGGIIDTDGIPGLGLGDALSFVNSSTGAAVTGESQGLQTMIQVTVGAQSGLYYTSNISFTALSNGLNWTGAAYRPASPFAAKSGSLIQLQIVNVTGPTGAKFSLWDEAVNLTEPAITYTIGTSSTTAWWNLTDLSLTVGDGILPNPTGVNNPPTDPYGHIHGRSFTADMPGSYAVSFMLHDASGQQADSAPFTLSYSAVPEPGTFALLVLGGLAALIFLRSSKWKKNRPLAIAGIFATALLSAQAHQHFYAGIVDENNNGQPDAGEALRFVNPAAADAVFHLYPKATGKEYGGYYALDDAPRPLFPNDYFTFAALSSGDVEAAAPFHAAPGSSIWAQVTSVAGPAGAEVGFWDENWGLTHTTPTQSFLTGESTGGFSFVLSESGFPPDPDEDPQGHIHERAWTVTQPGDYYVTFTLIDRSSNGPGGGPIHDPSVPYTFHFVAVPEPGTLSLLGISAFAGSLLWRRRRR